DQGFFFSPFILKGFYGGIGFLLAYLSLSQNLGFFFAQEQSFLKGWVYLGKNKVAYYFLLLFYFGTIVYLHKLSQPQFKKCTNVLKRGILGLIWLSLAPQVWSQM
ncbi:hypothetical protein ACJX0J_007872, partial [Zea mays]